MKTKIKVETEIDVKSVFVSLPVRYGTDDIPDDFPMRNGNKWEADIDIDTGAIYGWPELARFAECSLNMKVCDSGTYVLYDDKGNIVATRKDYVPHGIIPGEYGDYVDLVIKNGIITNWPKHPDVSAFFNQED